MKRIEYPHFDFDSDLARAVIELERTRAKLTSGTTPPVIFFQLKELFQLLTSVMSARIEGNRTSVLDAVAGAIHEKKSRPIDGPKEGVEEILNIQKGITFIDENVDSSPLDHLFIRELHRIVVSDLIREGDRTPGAYRLGEVSIGRSNHKPPFPSDVLGCMTELLDFASESVASHKQLLQSAIVHHRFLWIHPFGNGNGRVARLVTYAMLVKQGFTSTSEYRALNPTAVFGADRNDYYDNLERADRLDNEGIIAWCTYVLNGLKTDLDHLANLTNSGFVVAELLHPAIARLQDSGKVTFRESEALRIVADRTTVKAGDLQSVIPGSASTRSQAIRKLIDRGLLAPTEKGARFYRLVFAPSELTVHLVHQLDRVGFLPTILKEDLL